LEGKSVVSVDMRGDFGDPVVDQEDIGGLQITGRRVHRRQHRILDQGSCRDVSLLFGSGALKPNPSTHRSRGQNATLSASGVTCSGYERSLSRRS
jgi:hypothetical protein